MNPSPYFFRVEHDLLRSEAFKALGGSAIKVYLVLGLYSDFGTDWAYPSIRTIARQAGLSRQTVLNAIDELTNAGILVTSKARGRSTAYRILRQAPQRPTRRTSQNTQTTIRSETLPSSGLFSLEVTAESGLNFLDEPPKGGLELRPGPVQLPPQPGPWMGPNEN